MNIQFKTVSTAVAYYVNLRISMLPVSNLANLAVLLDADALFNVTEYIEQQVKSKLSKDDQEFLFGYANSENHTIEDQMRENDIIFEKIDKIIQESFKVNPLHRRDIKDGGILYPSGTFRHYPTKAKNDEYTLEELQKYAGGYIQILRLTDELVMVIDEEGKLKDGNQTNHVATFLATIHDAIFPGDFIVGKAFICYSKYIK